MWRYFAAATLIVVLGLAILLALPRNGNSGRPRDRYVTGGGTPGPGSPGGAGYTALPVTGAAPWALSALPECFVQRSQRSGPAAFALRALPRGLRPVPPGRTLHAADCALEVRDGTLRVLRGDNRLDVPPVARAYVSGVHVIVVRQAEGRTDVRTFSLADGRRPDFEPANRSR